MLTRAALLSPLALQAAVMVVDEFYFHRRRELPAWERIGHPLDTFTVVSCFAWLAIAPRDDGASAVFLGLAAFSCLFVTKDEFVHSERCNGAEHWLHSMLFLLHPICFFAAWRLWRMSGFDAVLKAQLVLLLSFMAYQVFYWNLRWKSPAQAK